jgi:hypothetical protein
MYAIKPGLSRRMVGRFDKKNHDFCEQSNKTKLERKRTKIEIPNHKSQISNKFQLPMTKITNNKFNSLEFEIYLS